AGAPLLRPPRPALPTLLPYTTLFRSVTELLPPAEHGDYFPAALAAARYRGRLYAIPWFVDAGLLYYRKDLLAAHGFAPPRTWDRSEEHTSELQSRENLVCRLLLEKKK